MLTIDQIDKILETKEFLRNTSRKGSAKHRTYTYTFNYKPLPDDMMYLFSVDNIQFSTVDAPVEIRLEQVKGISVSLNIRTVTDEASLIPIFDSFDVDIVSREKYAKVPEFQKEQYIIDQLDERLPKKLLFGE